MNEKSVLIVEDEPAILLGLEDAFEGDGYRVHTARDGRLALDALDRGTPDLLILDLMLPEIDGIEVCRRARRTLPQLPIIMVTAKSQEGDKVLGLEEGADDYVTKPFSIQELLARGRALLRRCHRTESAVPEVCFGDIQVDFEAYRLCRDGREHALSPLEAKMLAYFLEHEGRAVSRNEFLKEVWGYDRFPTTRTVDFHVLRLRQKIEQDPNSPRYIRTVHGVGYRFQRRIEEEEVA